MKKSDFTGEDEREKDLIAKNGEEQEPNPTNGEKPLSREGHRQREKELVRNNGIAGRYEYAILEFLLFYCVPRRDTKPISYELINKFGNLYGVFNAPYELLEQTGGIGKDASTFLRALGEICERYNDESGKPQDPLGIDSILEHMRRIVEPNVEACYIINVGNTGGIISVEKVMEGADNALEIPHKLILKTAMNANARRAVVLHNHPSGKTAPSETDIAHTFILATCFEEVHIELIDHLIVYETFAYSVKNKKAHKHNWRLR